MKTLTLREQVTRERLKAIERMRPATEERIKLTERVCEMMRVARRERYRRFKELHPQ